MLSRNSSTRTDAGLKSQGSRSALRSQGSQNLLRKESSRVKSEGNSRWLNDMAEDREEEQERYRD
jgi:hypothetical protein